MSKFGLTISVFNDSLNGLANNYEKIAYISVSYDIDHHSFLRKQSHLKMVRIGTINSICIAHFNKIFISIVSRYMVAENLSNILRCRVI